MFSSRG